MNNKELKDKIVKMLNDDYVVDELGATSPYIIADAVESIADDIVNLLPIHDVSQRSELLIDYMKWFDDNRDMYYEVSNKEMIDEYIKSINCG